MEMTEKDLNMIRQTMTDVLATHTAEINGRFNVIHTQLLAIKEQTTKTNGRVTKAEEVLKGLEIADINHLAMCPNQSRIKALEDAKTEENGMVKFVFKAGSIIGGVALIVIAVLELIYKSK